MDTSKASFLNTSSANWLAQVGVRVAPEITNLNPARDPLLARWAPKARTNKERSAVYTRLTALDFATATSAFFPEGQCPPDITMTKDQRSVVKKSWGLSQCVTNVAIEAMNNACNAQGLGGAVQDEVARLLATLDIGFRNFTDYTLFEGNSTLDPNAFDGLYKTLVTDTVTSGSVVVNLAGTDLARADLYDSVAAILALGIKPTAIVTNPMMVSHIQQMIYETGGCCDTYDPFGNLLVPTPAGNLPLIADPHVGVTYVSGNDYTTTVYILTENYDGHDIIYMDYLIPQSMIAENKFDATTDGSGNLMCTSRCFGMYAHGALVIRAPEAQVVLTNAGFNANGGLNTIITPNDNL